MPLKPTARTPLALFRSLPFAGGEEALPQQSSTLLRILKNGMRQYKAMDEIPSIERTILVLSGDRVLSERRCRRRPGTGPVPTNTSEVPAPPRPRMKASLLDGLLPAASVCPLERNRRERRVRVRRKQPGWAHLITLSTSPVLLPTRVSQLSRPAQTHSRELSSSL